MRLVFIAVALCLAAPASACPPGAAASCGATVRDVAGCCPVVAEAPRWCAPGQAWQGVCCPAGQIASGGVCVAAICDRAHPARCLLAGDAARAVGRPADLTTAEKLYGVACDAKLVRGCVSRAEVRLNRDQNREETDAALAKSRPIFAAACKAGDQLACADLATYFEMGLGDQPPDLVAAAALRERGCRAGDLDCCVDLAKQRDEGRGVPPDPAAAAAARLAACRAWHGEGCAAAAVALQHGRGVAADPVVATQLFRRACEAGSARACWGFGAALFGGRGTTANEAAALPWIVEACDRGQWGACADVGWMTAHGRGTTADATSGRAILSAACDHGSADGCLYLGELWRDGQGGATDAAQAARLFAKGCDAGDADACAARQSVGGERATALITQLKALDKDSRFAEMVPLLDELVALQEQRFGAQHEVTLQLMWQSAELQVALSRWDRALEVLNLLAARERKLPEPRPVPLADVLDQLVTVLLDLPRPDEALVVADENLALREHLPDAGPSDALALGRARKASVLLRLGRAAEAIPLLRTARAQVAPTSTYAAILDRMLAESLDATGDVTAARALRAQLVANAIQSGDREAAIQLLLAQASVDTNTDDRAALEQTVSAATALVDAATKSDVRAALAMWQARVADARGDHAGAEQLIDAALSLPGLGVDAWFDLTRRRVQAFIDTGRVSEAAQACAAMRARVEALGLSPAVHVVVLLFEHRIRELQADEVGAAAALAEAERLARGLDPRSGALAPVLALRADARESANPPELLAGLALREEVFALELARLGPVSGELLSPMSLAALTAAKAGRKVRALYWIERMEALLAAQHPEPPSFRAALLAVKSSVLQTLGDYDASMRASRDALAYAEQTWGPDSDQVGTVLLQRMIATTSDPVESLAIADRVLRIAAKSSNPAEQKRYASVAPYRLDLLVRLGRMDEACAAAAATSETAGVDAIRGACARRDEQPDLVLDLLRREMDQRMAAGGDALQLDSFVALAWLLRHPAQRVATVALLRDGIRHDDERMSRTIATAGGAVREPTFRIALWQTADLLRIDPEVAKLILPIVVEAAVRRKAMASEAAAEWQALQHRGLTDASGSAARQIQLRQQLAALALGGRAGMPEAEQRRLIVALEGELEALPSAAPMLTPGSASAEAVTAAIPTGAAVIDLELAVRVDLSAGANMLVDFGVIALVLRGDRPPAWVDLGDSKALGAKVKTLRKALAGHTPSADVAASELYAALIPPLEPSLDGVSELIVVPETPVQLTPWAALRSPKGEWLGRRFRIRYLDHARALIPPAHREAPRSPPLVLAAPDYGPASGRGAVRHFAPLPGTAAEGRALAALLPGATLLYGAGASEVALDQAQGPAVLHIATHGYFLADLPLSATLASARGASLVIGDAPATRPAGTMTGNPLLRSGLALAGANRAAVGDRDGMLSALEAADLDLRGTQLVVLSACETGVGDVEPGAGVAGLTSALRQAGARSTVLSLWQVDDDATRAFMSAFYRELLAGVPRGEALRRAQLTIAAQPRWAHPYYWAAFVLNGDDGPVSFK